MGIHAATRTYEDRLPRQVAVDRAALGQKHQRRAADPGDFCPKPHADMAWFRRMSGVGSLGRPRILAIGRWQGGRAAREAKAIVASGATTHDSRDRQARAIRQLLGLAIRSPDPFLGVHGTWIVRRLSPDTSRIRLADLPSDKDDRTLLHAMGFELANFHLGSRKARSLQADLKKLGAKWLTRGAAAMHDQVLADWKQWRAAGRGKRD